MLHSATLRPGTSVIPIQTEPTGRGRGPPNPGCLDGQHLNRRGGAEGRSDYLQILIERLRAGRVVLVAGAALGSGRPTWRGRVGPC